MTINYIKNYVQKEGAVIHMKNAKKYTEKVSDSGEDVWLSLKTVISREENFLLTDKVRENFQLNRFPCFVIV